MELVLQHNLFKMASLALVQQMMALHLLNSAAMAEAGSTNPDDQAAQALAKKVKSGLNEACIQNQMCVVMAIIAAQQTRSGVEENNPGGLSIADKDPTGGKLENPGHQGESETTLTTPDSETRTAAVIRVTMMVHQTRAVIRLLHRFLILRNMMIFCIKARRFQVLKVFALKT